MADAALAATALLMGLAGGPHCAAMCGTAQAGLTAQGGARAVVALQLGRVAG
jgi:sulfite exporter TauE/SafE